MNEFSDLTSREKEVLKALIELYCKKREPISSFLLYESLNHIVSPATLRNECFSLTKKGYLKKIHSFSGRIPTDKGLKFYLFSMLEDEHLKKLEERLTYKVKEILSSCESPKNFQEALTEVISQRCQSYSFFYSYQDQEFIIKGLKFLINEINFLKEKHWEELGNFLDNLEEILKNMKIKEEMEFFIGKENPYLKLEPLAMVITFNKNRNKALGILGHKKILFFKNIAFLRVVKNFID